MKTRHGDEDTIVHKAGTVGENSFSPFAQADSCLAINITARQWRGKEEATGQIRQTDVPAWEG